MQVRDLDRKQENGSQKKAGRILGQCIFNLKGDRAKDGSAESGPAELGMADDGSSKDGCGMKPHLDLKEINRRQLIAAGLKGENVMVSEIDTFTNEQYFSARREQKGKEKCGRILSGFVIGK